MNPQISRVYHLLAQALLETNNRDEAVRVMRQGYQVAEERGDFQPRDDLARLLVQVGETVPVTTKATAASEAGDGFHCQRPGCVVGANARKLPARPFGVDRALADRIVATVCAECWDDWLRHMSVKVINELRLDLSTEHGAEEYDHYMREYLGLD